MVFHLGFELPAPEVMDAEGEDLTPLEVKIVQKQIRKNSAVIDDYVDRLDLLVNKEHHPNREVFIRKIRERMFLLMEENDTFRRLLWRHWQGKIPRVKVFE